jgi:hypothetical protein
MFALLKTWSTIIASLFAASAMLSSLSPAHADSGHGPAADKGQTSQEAPARQCARRDTYNDIYYVNC